MEELDNENIVAMKVIQELITFLLEDFVEVGLQFFYFEKYSFMPNDMIVYLNAFFMIYKAFELTVRVIIMMNDGKDSFR